MNIFVSYASEYRDLAQRLTLAFEAEGHESFLDRQELAPGQPYQEALREAVQGCDLFVFLVAPESVEPGCFALSELALAEERWRHPAGRVLPVMAAPTPFATIPPYLAAVTLLQPEGDVVAETVAAVARLQRPRWRWWLGAAAVLVTLGAGGGLLWKQQQADLARATLEAGIGRELAALRELCGSGSYGAAWERLDEMAAKHAGRTDLPDARADCAMQWLRDIRVRVGEQAFTDIVRQVQPALVAQLAAASGQRAADLRAHLGWADYLRARDGAADADPARHYQRALQDEPGNVFAHAMWGHNLMSAGRDAEALPHFDAALASARERPAVRALQLASTLQRIGQAPHAVRALDAMRRNGETPASTVPARAWHIGYYGLLFNAQAETRARFLALLPPADHLATFDWLFPNPEAARVEPDTLAVSRAILLAHAGRGAEARALLQPIRTRREAAKEDGYLLDEVRRQLAALR